MPDPQPKRVAIVGGGCAGITSFWALQNSVHDVHLLEASANLGGRAKSVPFESNERRIHVNAEPATFNAHACRQYILFIYLFLFFFFYLQVSV